MRPFRSDAQPGSRRADGSVAPVMRPAPLVLLAYAFLLWIAQLFAVIVLERPEGIGDYDRAIIGGVRASHLFLALHLGWLVLMLVECRRAWSSPPGLRKGHLAGAVMGAALAGALCIWALRFAGWPS